MNASRRLLSSTSTSSCSKGTTSIITLLSPSEDAAMRSRDALCRYFGAKEASSSSSSVGTNEEGVTFADELFGPSILLETGSNSSLLHLLPMLPNRYLDSESQRQSELSLLSIMKHDGHVGELRSKLGAEIKRKHKSTFLVRCKLNLSRMWGKESVTDKACNVLVGKEEQIFLDLPQEDSNIQKKLSKGEVMENPKGCRLKEVVIPFFTSSTDPMIQSIGGRFSLSALKRPQSSSPGRSIVGVYEWPTVGCGIKPLLFRPIPAARNDMSLPYPSLIFHCDSLEEQASNFDNVAKVGFSGGIQSHRTRASSQIIVQHRDLQGLDLRFCDSETIPLGFAEAQDALFASSLAELQNTNVMAEGSKGHEKSDPMTNVGDCWVEFRAHMKHPGGFLGTKRRSSPMRVAKAPDLPYE